MYIYGYHILLLCVVGSGRRRGGFALWKGDAAVRYRRRLNALRGRAGHSVRQSEVRRRRRRGRCCWRWTSSAPLSCCSGGAVREPLARRGHDAAGGAVQPARLLSGHGAAARPLHAWINNTRRRGASRSASCVGTHPRDPPAARRWRGKRRSAKRRRQQRASPRSLDFPPCLGARTGVFARRATPSQRGAAHLQGWETSQ